MGMYAEWSKANKIVMDLKEYESKRRLINFRKKLIVKTKFPNNTLTLVTWPKLPDIFQNSLTIPWPGEILFFPDFSLTRGNPVCQEKQLLYTTC